MRKNRRKLENPDKYIEKSVNNRVKCKCGKSIEFWTNNRKVVCQWCGNYVFKTKKDEFEYRMKERLRK